MVMMVAMVAVACVTHGAVVVAGGSMEPTLGIGDVCVYRRSSSVRPGQVVVFEREPDGGLVVHRAMTVGLRGEVRTKGDANDAADRELLAPDRVRGPVVIALPVGRVTRR